MRKEQLTECEGDVITHAQQLAETYRASIFVDPQLCNPASVKELLHPSNAPKGITWWMHDRAIYRAIPIMQKEVLVGPSEERNLTAKTAPWANMFFAKEIHQIGISSRNSSSPFASKSHWLLVVRGYNDPVALGILGNGIQHHVERSIVTSKTQAKGGRVKENQSPRRPGLVCPLPPHPPVVCVLPAGVDGVLAALFLCQLPLFIHVRPPYQLHTQTEPLHLRQAQSFQHKRPRLLIGNSKIIIIIITTQHQPALCSL